ncbi:MAG TPA: ArsI/CadI family heavy metal resistance metalloenzyme [Armatimonadota bacterium]|nr:ArsI/CadI family heavy metal resistance metalloenzyme [Armatimonadota bacterium]
MTGNTENSRQLKTHISLNVADIPRSVAFYEAFFGVPAHKRRAGYANFDLADPALKLALQENPPTNGTGSLNHLGIQVAAPEQVDAARKRLVDAGLATFDEGDTLCCYARRDKIWAHDPDGNGWEVYFLLDDMLDDEDHTGGRMGASTDEPAAAGCCEDEANVCCAG